MRDEAAGACSTKDGRGENGVAKQRKFAFAAI
jgi:hypothetical protein